jgi:hypothetical protein
VLVWRSVSVAAGRSGFGEVRALEVADLAADLGRGAAQDDAAALHDEDAVGDLERAFHMLFDKQDRDPPVVGRGADGSQHAIDDERREAE